MSNELILNDQHKQLIIKSLPELSLSDEFEYTVTKLNSLTNDTFLLLIDNKYKFIFKIFGTSRVMEIIDRKNEVNLINYSYNIGRSSKIYYYDDSIRIEEFLEGENLKFENMQNFEVIEQILLFFKEFISYPNDNTTENMFYKIIKTKTHPLINIYKDKVSYLLENDSTVPKSKLEIINNLIEDDNLLFLINKIESFNSETVMSHNDLLNNNVLINKGKYYFIDFEYGDYCFPMYDIANYINESIIVYDNCYEYGFNIETSKRPSKEYINKIIIEYLKIVKNLKIEEINDSLIESYYNQFNLCVLLSHFYWILWSIIMFKEGNSTFNYLEFGYQRTLDYFEYKKINNYI